MDKEESVTDDLDDRYDKSGKFYKYCFKSLLSI